MLWIAPQEGTYESSDDKALLLQLIDIDSAMIVINGEDMIWCRIVSVEIGKYYFGIYMFSAQKKGNILSQFTATTS